MLSALRKNLSTTDLRFVQVIKVEKREPRKSFLKPRPRPTLKNDQAEAEKCFRGSLFSTEVTWEKLKSDVDKFFLTVASTIFKTKY